MTLPLLTVGTQLVLVQHTQHHLSYVELETQQQKRRKKVGSLNLLCHLLDEPHLVNLPLYQHRTLNPRLFLSRLLLSNLPPQRPVVPQPRNTHPPLGINLKHLRKQIVEQHLFFPTPENTFALDMLVQPEPSLALRHDIVQYIDP